MIPLPPTSTLFPYTTLFRSSTSSASARTSSFCPTDSPTTRRTRCARRRSWRGRRFLRSSTVGSRSRRSEEHTSELQSRENLVCRLLLEKKKKQSVERYKELT